MCGNHGQVINGAVQGLRCVRDVRAVVDSAVANGYGTVGLGGDTGIMRDEHNGLATFLEFVEGLHHERSGGGVQVSRRLVRQDDGRVVDEGARDGNPLHLSA